jgi:hypothetical protein
MIRIGTNLVSFLESLHIASGLASFPKTPSVHCIDTIKYRSASVKLKQLEAEMHNLSTFNLILWSCEASHAEHKLRGRGRTVRSALPSI